LGQGKDTPARLPAGGFSAACSGRTLSGSPMTIGADEALALIETSGRA